MTDTKNTTLETTARADAATPAARGPFANQDWWSVWIGLLLIVVSWGLFASGGSIKWLAVAPAK